jgi:hypothetical protein
MTTVSDAERGFVIGPLAKPSFLYRPVLSQRQPVGAPGGGLQGPVCLHGSTGRRGELNTVSCLKLFFDTTDSGKVTEKKD